MFTAETSTGTFAIGWPEALVTEPANRAGRPTFKVNRSLPGRLGSGNTCGMMPGAMTRTSMGSIVAEK